MQQAAPWWNNPKANDDSPVIAHTPDPTRYWHLDNRQQERVRGGIRGVVVPRANDDGTSMGFYGPAAGVVHVDPEAPDGGAVVDLSRMNSSKLGQAFSLARYPHEVFYNLSDKTTDAAPSAAVASEPSQALPQTRDNPFVPLSAYVVPASAEDGTQTHPYQESHVQPAPPMPQPSQPQPQQQQPQQPQQVSHAQQPAHASPPQTAGPAVQPAPVANSPATEDRRPPAQQAPPQQAAPPVYQPPAQNNSEVMAALGQLTQVVSGLAHNFQQQPPVPPLNSQPQPQSQPRPQLQSRVEPSRHYRIPTAEQQPRNEQDWEESRPQTLNQMEEAQQEHDGFIVGFETLEMPFVRGPIPEKAKREVFFEMPGIGRMLTRYHDVVDGGNCVALIYDTRYEDGQQFLPPDMGHENLIHVEVPRMKSKKKTFVCASLGIHFTVGVLDIVVLPCAEPEESDTIRYEEE